jgi:hypothetical protein
MIVAMCLFTLSAKSITRALEVGQANTLHLSQKLVTTVRHNSLSNREKQIWVIRGKKTKAKGNNRKPLSLVQRKNEN